MMLQDSYYMRQALQLARQAAELGEIPVGAVVVAQGSIIAKAHNSTEQLYDVTAHAELLALTAAAQHLGAKYLHDCTLYVTLEPCVMCAGALAWAQLPRLVIGAADPKSGYLRHGKGLLHKRTRITTGVLGEECRELMQSFFRERR